VASPRRRWLVPPRRPTSSASTSTARRWSARAVFGSFGPSLTETAAAGAWNASGWSGNYAINRTTGNPASFTTLDLHGLSAHTGVSIGFVLGFLESWDGRNGTVTPDNLEIYLDGVQIANYTATNASGSFDDFGSSSIIAYRQQVNGNTYFSDTLIGFSGVFAHTSSDLNLKWRAAGAGWQGGDDEGFGLDNIQLSYVGAGGGVPEPATWALMIAGFGLAGATLRRRRPLTA
jgi:hypothetical protein